MPFTYVYILESLSAADRHYVGCTNDLAQRLRHHNGGHVPHTAKFSPWRIKAALAVVDEAKARALEKYLKTHAGRKFTKIHL